jgi:hypothetical protein
LSSTRVPRPPDRTGSEDGTRGTRNPPESSANPDVRVQGARKKPPSSRGGRGLFCKIPAMTDFRARGTIMGLAGLTAVFGMGTGVAPPVWSPGIRTPGGQAGRPQSNQQSGHADKSTGERALRGVFRHIPGVGPLRIAPEESPRRLGLRETSPRRPGRRHGCDGRRVGVVKRSAVGTGPLRRSPAVHSQPIDLVVFQEPSELTLMETSS